MNINNVLRLLTQRQLFVRYILVIVGTVILIPRQHAQQVLIGDGTLHPPALLQIESEDQGILIPRMTSAEIMAISSPAQGLQVYNINTNCTHIRNEDKWVTTCPTDNPRPKLINNKGFVGLGTAPHHSDFYCYTPSSDQWEQNVDFPGDARFDVLSFTIGSNAYIGGGFQVVSGSTIAKDDFYKYNSETNTWSQIADFPYQVWNGVATSNGKDGIVGLGSNGSNTKELYIYLPDSDEWIPIVDFISARIGSADFTIDHQSYIGLGIDTDTPKSDYYKLNFTKYYESAVHDRSVIWSPILKHKRIERVSAPNQGEWITLPTGLITDQIIEANIYIDHLSNGSKTSFSFTHVNGFEFDNWIKSNSEINIINHPTNSSQILNKPIVADMIYQD